jgi:quinoprotein glucose dehydrogenase
VLGLVAAFGLGCEKAPPPPVLDMSGPVADWPDYGHGKDATAFSPLRQITPENVAALTVAWEHHSGDISDGSGDTSRTSFQARAIVPNGTLYYCSGLNKVFALDPETGKERWRFDPKLQNRKLGGPYPLVCRGVAYWKDSSGAPAACSERILTATIDSELIALDAASGEPCADFGTRGRVDLRQGFAEAPRWEAYVTSPPLVLGDVAVVGGLVQDNLRVDAPSGVIRGFDVRTGALRWAFDPIPPGTPPPADGRYTLTALASQISANGQQMASNYTFGDAQGLFRFYGDMNGDHRVDISDFGFFSLAYLQTANYNAALDYNNDGRIDIADFGQFSVRYFTSLP